MIGPLRRPACRTARAGLPALADGRFEDAAAAGALAHVAGCAPCRAEAERLALLVHQLRRLGPLAASAEADRDRAWATLRDRIVRGRAGLGERVLRARAELAGLVLSAFVVAVAVAPSALHVPLAGSVGEPVGGSADQWERQAWLLETSYATDRRGTLASASATTGGPARAGIPRSEPDRLLPIRKEVEPARTAGQPAASPVRIAGPS